MGRLLCSAVRDWFGCDAAMINGGTIKGGTTYATPALSLLDLRRELPFPTKMIVCRYAWVGASRCRRAFPEGRARRRAARVPPGLRCGGRGRPRPRDFGQRVSRLEKLTALPRNLVQGAVQH